MSDESKEFNDLSRAVEAGRRDDTRKSERDVLQRINAERNDREERKVAALESIAESLKRFDGLVNVVHIATGELCAIGRMYWAQLEENQREEWREVQRTRDAERTSH